MQTKRKPAAALGWVLFDGVKEIVKILLLSKAGNQQGLVQAIIGKQMPYEAAAGVEPDFGPGLPGIGAIMVGRSGL